MESTSENTTINLESLEFHFNNCNYSTLEKICYSLIKRGRHQSIAYYYLGESYLALQEFDRAEEALNCAYNEDPQNIHILNALARVYFINNDTEKVKECFNKALAINELDEMTNFNYGLFLYKIEDFKNAITILSKYNLMTKNKIKSSIILSTIFNKMGKYTSSIILLEPLIEEYITEPEFFSALLDAYCCGNQYEKVESCALQIIQKNYDTKISEELVRYLFDKGLYTICIKCAQEAVQKHGFTYQITYDLAKSCYFLSDKQNYVLYMEKLKDMGFVLEDYQKTIDILDANLPDIEVQLGSDKPRLFNGSWYRGEHTNFHPSKANLSEVNAIKEYVLEGWLPEKSFITKQHKITAFGSCFAKNISLFLKNKNYSIMGKDMVINSHVIRCGEGIVNTYAVLQQFEWAFENKQFSEDLWYGSNKEIASYSEKIKEETKNIFEQTDVFIITLGLSEIWYNKQTEEVFWRAIPKEQFNPEIHGFRVSTVSENITNLQKIHSLIRKHRPDATIIFTLSPIPLNATFRPISCVTANSVSKAILRAALDELMRQNVDDKQLFYFPSYEIVKDYLVDPFEEDNRHLEQKHIELIMHQFEKHYCISSSI